MGSSVVAIVPDRTLVSPVMRAALLALCLLLVGCTTSAATDGDADPLTSTQRAWLDDHGPIVVGVPRTIAPAVVVDDGGEVAGGWAWELTELAGLKVGADVTPVVFDTVPETVEALRSGVVDVVTGLSSRPDLLAFAAPTTPLSWTPVVFAVGPDRPGVTSEADLPGLTVTTIPGSAVETRLGDGIDGMRYVPATSLLDALVKVYDGTTDVWAGPLAITSHQLASQGRDEPLRVVGEPLAVVQVGAWGVPGPALQIIEAGRSRTTDTELAVIHVRWTGFDLTDPTADEVPGWLVPALLALLAVALVFAVFILLLRRQVAVRTAQARAAAASLSVLNEELEETVAERTEGLATANVQLVRSNDALARFARRAAHDLRGPLTAILGFARVAASPRLTDEQRARSLDTIATTSRHMADLVEEMLEDASALVPAANASIPAAELRSWLEDFMALEAERFDATVGLEVDRPQVDLPVTDLKQLLLNLVGNALKHGGRPGLRVDVRLDRTDGPQPRWSVIVDDDGQGVPPDQRELVLERGYRTASASELGSGLGLAACRETVRALGGSITVSESPSGGARISMSLPATRQRSDEPARDPQTT